MATTPAFASTPIAGEATTGTAAAGAPLAVGTTNSNAATVYTAGANGSRIDEVSICGLGATSNNLVILYVHDGTTFYPLKAIVTTATTASATVAPFMATVSFNNLLLPTNYSLKVGLFGSDGAGYSVTAFGGDF